METDILVGKQVIGWKSVKNKWVLDENVVSIIKMMYPDFRLVKGTFDIYPEDSFIYVGNPDYINSVKGKPNPHIILARTGIDFTDREVLLEYVYDFIGKSIPKTVKEVYTLWDDDLFYRNLKFLFVLGKIPDTSVEGTHYFLDLVSNFDNPVNFIRVFFKVLDTEAFNFCESSLLTFVYNSKNMDDLNTKSNYMARLRTKFVRSYANNVSVAVYNTLNSNIDNVELRFFNFVMSCVNKKVV